MFGIGGEERFNPEVQIEAARLDEARQVDRFREEAWGQRPLKDDPAHGPANERARLAWIVVGLIAAVGVTWFYGGNTPGLVAGAVAGLLVVALAVRWWRQRP